MDNEISSISEDNLIQMYEDNKEDGIFADHKELIDSMPSVDTKYIEKIEEFEKALQERDQFIGQLQDCIYRKDQIQNETEIKCVEFAKEIDSLKQEIDSLKHKLEESITLLQNKTTVSVVEHLELKNKLIEIQQNRIHEREEFDSLYQELQTNRETQSELETKYKLIAKVHKEANERHIVELEERKNLLEKKHKDELNFLRAQHLQELKEREAQEQARRQKSLEEFNQCKEEVNEAKKQNNLLLEEITSHKSDFDAKIQELLLRIEAGKQHVQQLQKEKDDKILENMKEMEHLEKELREKYDKEVENLKHSNKAEVAAITEQIDFIEKKQIEEQKKVMDNLKEIHNEGQRYKRELETERGVKVKLLSEVEEARLMIISLESKHSLLEMELKTEKETSERRLLSLNELMDAQKDLKNQVTQLEENIKLLNENERRHNAEHEMLAKVLDIEKEDKNKANLRIQELSSKNDSLLRELDASKCQFSLIMEKSETLCSEVEDLESKLKVVEDQKNSLGNKMSELEYQIKEKQNLDNEIIVLKRKLSDTEYEKESLCHTITSLNAKISENSDLEAKVNFLSQEIQSCEKYKHECHALNEKIYNLCETLDEKCDTSSDRDVLRDCTVDSDSCDAFSLLQSKLTFMSDKLNETNTEIHSVVRLKDFYKEELDKLNLKFKEKCEFDSDLSAMKPKNISRNDQVTETVDDTMTRHCSSCKTVITTRDQGFQTSFDHSASGLLTTQTIEEDYTIEEILIVPKTISLRGSVSLKNLKEIGAAENDTDPTLSSNLVSMDYEQLRSKYHDLRFVIKSLEYENSRLRRALLFKKSVKGKGLTSTDDLEPRTETKDNDEICLVNEHLELTENSDPKVTIRSKSVETSYNSAEPEREIKYPEQHIAREQEPGPSSSVTTSECIVDKSQSEDSSLEDHFGESANEQIRDDKQTVLTAKLQCQTKLNRALMEELKTRFCSSATCSDEWQTHLRRAVELFMETQHPYFEQKEILLTSYTEGWEEIAKLRGSSFKENKVEEELKREEKEEDKGDEPNDLIFSSVLSKLQNLIEEQRAVQMTLKDVESKIIIQMEKNLLQVTQEFCKDNSLDVALRGFDSTLFKSGSTLVEDEVEKNDILKEFQDITSSMLDRTQEGKMKLLQNQRNVLKILEENQTRITDILKKHLDNLRDASLEADGQDLLVDLAKELDASLNEEVISVEKMYGEILKQHSHEQALHAQSHVFTLNELKARINSFLQQRYQYGHLSSNIAGEETFGYINRFRDVCETNSSFSNSDVWKRLLAVLSQITVNLLHYYTVSQRFANDEGDMPLAPNLIPAVAGACTARIFPSVDESEDENSLKLEFDDRCPADEGSMNILDTTCVSEGIMEDLERSEQVKEVLATSYPNLAKTLKGNYEHILIENLEKEVQEFIISLQASTGMLRIFMLSKADEESSASSSKAVMSESGVALSIEPFSMDTPRTKQDARDKSISSMQIDAAYLSKEFSNLSLADYTTLKPSIQVDVEALLAELKAKLSETRTDKEEMQRQLHQTQGLYTGLLDDNKSLRNDFKKKEETINELVKELTETKERLKKAEKKSDSEASTKINRKQNERNIKERVKAVLAAKDKECFDQKELANRVRDLEVILEETVTERDKSLEDLNLKVADLTQQLEVADRQLRSSRQFLEEQAAEREQEVEDLIKTNEKLKSQLKEKEALVSQHLNLQKEVQLLERQLKEHYSSLEEERTRTDEKQRDLSTALEKVNDLREVIHSLETQLAGKNSEQQCLLSQLESIKEMLKESKQQSICLQNELDTLNQNNLASKLIIMNPNELLYEGQGGLGSSLAPRLPLERQVSISEEIENSKRNLHCQTSEEDHYLSAVPLNQSTQNCNLSQDCSLIENLITRFEKSTRGLEALQFASITGTVLSDEELSVREQLEMNDPPSLEKTRSLSPGSLEAKLEEKFLSFERSAEAASKFIKDLEMRLSNLKAEYDDVVNEREYLHQRLSELGPIKAELKKASKESELLRNDFDNNLRVLNNDLDRSKKRETELQFKIEKLKSNLIAKKEESKNAIDRENSLEKKNKEMEKAMREYSEEKDSCRRQISDNLIRISSLEARIDEYRRSDSPHEFELKARINSLKDELENCRIELTMKYREIEELRYSVKELKDQMIVREEELDRLSQPLEHASLPQSALDHRRHLMQALEDDNRTQKMINQQLQEKLQNAVRNSESETVLSNNLLSSLLDEKNSKIRELMTQRKHFVDSTQEMLLALENKHPIYEAVKTLKNSLNMYMGWPSQIERIVCPELQRRAPQYSLSDDMEIREMNMVTVDEYENGGLDSGPQLSNEEMRITATTSESSNLNLEPLMTPENKIRDLSLKGNRKMRESCSGDSAASSFVARDYNDYEVIISENLVLKDQCALLEQEVRNLLEYQKKLEADFEMAQEMLETKEEELQALASEADDCVTVPLQNSSQINELLFENDSLRQRIQELELKIEADAFNLVSVSEVDKLAEELESVRKALDESTKRSEDLTKEMDTLNQKCSYLETRVEDERLRCENLKQSLERRNEENKELSLQIDRILTKHKDTAMRHEKKIKALERDHFKELQDMKDKNIEREKQLCNEYEERLSGQVSDLAVKLSREKEESLKEIKTQYEELLSKAMKENSNEVALGENASSGDVKGASEDLQSKLQRELDISAHLDQSLVSYFESGSVGSRESSVVSEGGVAQEEWNSSNLRVQSLMRKVYKEGIKVLAQSERLFLEENQYLIKENVTETFQESTSSQDEIKLLKKKVEIMKHRLKLEESLKEELQKEYSRKREEVEELREQLAKESLKHLNLSVNTCSYACKEVVKDTQEIVKLKEIIRYNEKQIQDLEEALKAERDNFSHVSNTLNHQRKQSSMTNEYQTRVIKELKDLLDKEKTRETALMAENQELRLLNCQSMPLDESFSLNSTLLDKEREIGELQLAVRNMTDEREIERDRYIKDLQMHRIQIEQLENSLMLAESKKKALMTELNNKDLLIKDLQANMKVYEKETVDFKDDIEDRISRKVEALSLINLNTMKQKDLEIEALTQRLCQVKTDLERMRVKEKTLKNEAQKNVNLEFPRIKNVREYIETLQRQNQELHESLIRYTDDKHLLRQNIVRLEGVIGEQERFLVRRNINEKNIHFAEKAALSTETSALKLALRQTETKNENLEKELKALQLYMEASAMDVGSKREDFTIKYLYWKFNRSESHRRALVWQKEYLYHMLRQNRRTEERALLRYVGLNPDVPNSNYERYPHVKLKGKARFKSAALIIVAIQRMKTITKRWQLGRKLEVFLKLPLSALDSQSSKISSCPIQPSSVPAEVLRLNVKSPPRLEANPINNAMLYQITGLTPPSKDVATWKPGSSLSRNLFDGDNEENKDLNDCVERLRSIHSLLGLPKSNS